MRERRRVEPPLRDLIIDLAVGDFVEPTLRFADPAAGRWGELSLAEYVTSLELSDGVAYLHAYFPPEALGVMHRMMDLKNQSMSLKLADGSRVDVGLANLSQATNGRAPIQLHHWIWQTGHRAQWWLGKVRLRLPKIGNLSVEEEGARGTYRCRHAWSLEGRYRWLLVPDNDDPMQSTVIVEPLKEAVDQDGVRADLMALQFAFGSSAQLTHLVGIGETRDAVAAFAVGQFERALETSRSPVPDFLADGEEWPPELFRLLSKKLVADGVETLTVAIASYLDSQNDHLDGAYLKAHVGLEAFAKRIVSKSTPKPLVRDWEQWKKWVRTLESGVRSHLTDGGPVDMVLGKFISAGNAPTGELVARVLGTAGISLPAEVEKEIANRNYPAHGFFMNKGMQYDLLRDARRLEMVQTLLSALVAVHVGYEGPLRGYDVTPDGERPSPSWWPAAWSTDDVLRLYVAKRHVQTSTNDVGRSEE